MDSRVKPGNDEQKAFSFFVVVAVIVLSTKAFDPQMTQMTQIKKIVH